MSKLSLFEFWLHHFLAVCAGKVTNPFWGLLRQYHPLPTRLSGLNERLLQVKVSTDTPTMLISLPFLCSQQVSCVYGGKINIDKLAGRVSFVWG